MSALTLRMKVNILMPGPEFFPLGFAIIISHRHTIFASIFVLAPLLHTYFNNRTICNGILSQAFTLNLISITSSYCQHFSQLENSLFLILCW